MIFESPLFLLLLLPVPFIIWFTDIKKERGGIIAFSFSKWSSSGSEKNENKNITFKKGSPQFLFYCSRVLFWAAVAAAAASLAGPAFTESKTLYTEPGNDILFILDISPSMAARDIDGSSRIDAAKQMMEKFIQNSGNDNIGLLLFASDASLAAPPTSDHDYVRNELKNAKIMALGEGTALGTALGMGVYHLSFSNAPKKSIVIISDGASNQGKLLPYEAAEAVRENNIALFAIAAGSRGSAEGSFKTPDGKRFYSGIFNETYNPEILKKTAEISGGIFLEASDTENLISVFDLIKTISSSEKGGSVYIEKKYKSFMLRTIALAAIILSWFIRRMILREYIS